VIFVVLGCAIQEIQSDRIQTAINYAKSLPKYTKVVWFLTGGVKSAISDQSEAEKMRMELFSDANVILDTKATNTAENFVNFKKWLYSKYSQSLWENAWQQDPKVVITTSEFHQKRASHILNGIFASSPLTNVEWNLGKKACEYCWSDEPIHMQNVEMDVYRALLLMEF